MHHAVGRATSSDARVSRRRAADEPPASPATLSPRHPPPRQHQPPTRHRARRVHASRASRRRFAVHLRPHRRRLCTLRPRPRARSLDHGALPLHLDLARVSTGAHPRHARGRRRRGRAANVAPRARSRRLGVRQARGHDHDAQRGARGVGGRTKPGGPATRMDTILFR